MTIMFSSSVSQTSHLANWNGLLERKHSLLKTGANLMEIAAE